MKTIILTNGTKTETHQVEEENFPQVMNIAKLTAESWGEGWEAKEPQPEVAETPEPQEKPYEEPEAI